MQFNETYNIDYTRLATLLAHMGKSLNSRKDRFDKADIIETAICEYCRGDKLLWADDIGFDLVDPKRGTKFEVKSQYGCLYTPKNKLKSKTPQIKLTNTLQQGNKKLLPTADWLIIVDSANGAVGIVSFYDVVERWSKEKDDGFACQIPTSEIQILSAPVEKLLENKSITSYAQAKQEARISYVRSF